MARDTIARVLDGRATWGCVASDAIEFLRSLPDDSVDLLMTSPPYELARTYGRDDMRGGQQWVDWMTEVVRTAAPKVRGLIAVNCEGQTRNYRYSCTPYLLMADLHRAGFNCRRPVFFHRVGIPGSGGPDWLRADVEPVVCLTRPGKLPWSDNTACGHPPKWAPGGEFSNRLSDGTRTNQWGKTGAATGTVAAPGEKPKHGKARPSHVTVTGEQADDSPALFEDGERTTTPPPSAGKFGNLPSSVSREKDGTPKVRLGRGMKKGVAGSTKGSLSSPGWTAADKIAAGGKRHASCDASPQPDGAATREQVYLPPVLANPGNVVQESYTADEVIALLAAHGDITHHNVGGGQMGHALAHENEAPFPLTLAEFFVKSFCPPGGVVADCFMGSGTVLDAALRWGRRAVGSDIRDSQVELTRRRMATVTPSLPLDATPDTNPPAEGAA